MGECKAGEYKDNSVITHFPFICFGGYSLKQPKCKYLIECAEEHNMHKTRSKKLKNAIYRKGFIPTKQETQNAR